MDISLSNEKLIEIAEKEVAKHIRFQMEAFCKRNEARSDGYDPRLDAVVTQVVRELLATEYKEHIKQTVKNIVPQQLAKLFVSEFRDQIESSENWS